MFKVISALIFLIVVIYAFGQNYYGYLLPVWYLESEVLRIIGLILLHLSLLWILIAQIQMGNSWRIGIDEKNQTELRTNGVFGLSRNPVFLGIVVSILGLFLVLPNALSLLVLFASWLILQIQIRLEEEYLLTIHGIQYEQYISKVRRWI
jgi:protein-S-isoprenylcysteine O-methyltransferase Ste14